MTSQILHFIKQASYLRVAKDRVVRLKYLVFNRESGAIIEFRDDLYYLHGGYGGAFPRVEEALEGMQVGAKVELALTIDEAYGQRDPAMIITGPADHFPPRSATDRRAPRRACPRWPCGRFRGDAHCRRTHYCRWQPSRGRHPFASGTGGTRYPSRH